MGLGAFDLAPRVLVGPGWLHTTDNNTPVAPTNIEGREAPEGEGEEKGNEGVQLHETVYLVARADLPIVGRSSARPR